MLKSVLKHINLYSKIDILWNRNLESEPMSNNIIFSCIMPVYNVEKYVSEAINSILHQTIGFKKHIELILVNDGSTDGSGHICRKYKEQYPDNIVYIDKTNGGVSSARNAGLDCATGKYITFLDSDDMLSSDAFEKVETFFNEHYEDVDFVCIPLQFFEAKTGPHIANYRFSESKVVDIRTEYSYINQFCNSAFFKSDAAKMFRFDTKLKIGEDSKYANQILFEKCKYGVLNTCFYLYRRRDENDSVIQSSLHNKHLYTDKMEHHLKFLVDYSIEKFGLVLPYVQFLVMYDMQWMLKTERIPIFLNETEKNTLHKNIDYLLSVTDEQYICDQTSINNELKNYLVLRKNEFNTQLFELRDDVVQIVGKNIFLLKSQIAFANIIEIQGNRLYFAATIRGLFNDLDYTVAAQIGDEIYNATPIHTSYRDLYCLDRQAIPAYCFEINVPFEPGKEQKIAFFICYKDITIPLQLDYTTLSNLNRFTGMYLLSNNHLISHCKDGLNNKLCIEPYAISRVIRRERLLYRHLKRYYPQYQKKVMAFRAVNHLFRWFFVRKKRVWLFTDRFDRADDNAEVLYNYAIKQKDGINKYFVIDGESPDYKRLKPLGHIVKDKSLFHKLLVMNCEKIISSHANQETYYPFDTGAIRFYTGFLTAQRVFLQHGVMLSDLSEWLFRLNKNLHLIVTSSLSEHSSFVQGKYGYEESTIRLLGLPRYDNLRKDRKNYILFAPTWNKNLVGHIQDGERIYNPDFKKTDYFKKINAFLNNTEFLSSLNTLGYRILFKPHPNLYEQLCDFSKNPYVEFADWSVSYNTLFREAALLITDYSSVAFDFAYTKSPVIYYQFSDFHLTEGYFSFKDMGFGEVVIKENDLVTLILDYARNNFAMKDLYKKRVDEFFYYKDYNNCERCYRAILDMPI